MLVRGALVGWWFGFVLTGLQDAKLVTYHAQIFVNHSRPRVRTWAVGPNMIGVNDRRSRCGSWGELGMFVLQKEVGVGFVRMPRACFELVFRFSVEKWPF
jgi:hypothetical protein